MSPHLRFKLEMFAIDTASRILQLLAMTAPIWLLVGMIYIMKSFA